MKGDNHPAKKALREARERVVAKLTESFASDALALEAFEERVNVAYQARTAEQLDVLVVDLAEADGPEVVPRSRHALVVAPEDEGALRSASHSEIGSARVHAPPTTKPPTFVRAILGSVERRGAFAMPAHAVAKAIFGSLVLDYRDVNLPAGTTELHLSAVFGSIEVIVPANVAVECEGSGILGTFEGRAHVPADDIDAPRLRIKGSAVLGSIEIRTRPPIEIERQALELQRERRKLSPR